MSMSFDGVYAMAVPLSDFIPLTVHRSNRARPPEGPPAQGDSMPNRRLQCSFSIIVLVFQDGVVSYTSALALAVRDAARQTSLSPVITDQGCLAGEKKQVNK